MTSKPLSIDQILVLISLHKKENAASLVMFTDIHKLTGSLRDEGYIEMIRDSSLGEGHWELTNKGNQMLKSLCTHYVDSGEPIPECARSHPHENMSPACEEQTAQVRARFTQCPRKETIYERGIQMKAGFSAPYGSRNFQQIPKGENSQMADIMAPSKTLPGHPHLSQFNEPRTSYDASDVEYFLQQFGLLPRFELCQNQDVYIMGNKTGGEWIRYEDVEEILKPILNRGTELDTRRFELTRHGYGGSPTLGSILDIEQILNLKDEERYEVDILKPGDGYGLRTCWTIKRIQ